MHYALIYGFHITGDTDIHLLVTVVNTSVLNEPFFVFAGFQPSFNNHDVIYTCLMMWRVDQLIITELSIRIVF